jgi:lipopolysaccharide export LptBFGC system permease protein LptF
MGERSRRGKRIGQTSIIVLLALMSFNFGLLFGRSGRTVSDIMALWVISGCVIVLLFVTIFAVWKSDG